MSTHTILIALGSILALAGIIGGGLSLKEITIPSINRFTRIISFIFGVIFIIGGIYVEKKWDNINHPDPPPPTLNPIAKKSEWKKEAGVCRDNNGKWPRWSAYDYPFWKCEEMCKDNPNCQGFAMSREKHYCQLFGSDGSEDASRPGTWILGEI